MIDRSTLQTYDDTFYPQCPGCRVRGAPCRALHASRCSEVERRAIDQSIARDTRALARMGEQ